MTRKEARALVVVAESQGGFTYDIARKSTPQSGYAFAPSPEFETKLLGPLTSGALLRYVRSHAAALRESGAHLGAWRDEGAWYLDVSVVSVVSDDLLVARTLARIAKQLAVYDLATRQSLML